MAFMFWAVCMYRCVVSLSTLHAANDVALSVGYSLLPGAGGARIGPLLGHILLCCYVLLCGVLLISALDACTTAVMFVPLLPALF